MFAEVLKYYINESHISVRKLSLETEIDRTVIHKYMSGRRLPKSVEEVKSLGRCLMLSSEKQRFLLESYNKSLYGEEGYQSFLTIRQILMGIPDYQVQKIEAGDKNNVELTDWYQQNSSKAIYFTGQIQVENALQMLLLEEIQKTEKVHVKIIAQPDNPSLARSLLKGYWKKNIEIEQIICLDDGSQSNHNISVIAYLLPLLQGDVSYSAYYYYDNQKAHINSMSLSPILILLNDYVIHCNLEMNECLIVKEHTEYEFYNRQYEQMKLKTELLTVCGSLPNQSLEFLCPVFNGDEKYIYIGSSPCFASCMSVEMLEHHIMLPEENKKIFIDTALNNTKVTMETPYMSNIFTEQGLRMLIEEGRTYEYPADFYSPLDERERKDIISQMVQFAAEGRIKYYMAKDPYLKLDPSLCTYINSKQGISIVKWKEDGRVQPFTVTEVSIKRCFFDFVDFAKENGWIYNENETVKKIKEIYSEYC